jgi:hypothetical protein
MSGILDLVKDNFKAVLLLGFGYAGALEFGYVEAPELPTGTWVIVLGIAVAAIGGYVASGMIYDLLPDDEGIYLFAFEAHDDTGGALYELSEDQFADLEVVVGSLFQWSNTAKRVYECRQYRPEENVAVGNWRESVAGSELAGDVKVVDALEGIEELRQEFEPEAQRFRRLQRRLRGVARKMDRRRLEDQQSVLDPHLSPTFGDDGAGVSGILNEELPDDLLPESMKATDADDLEDNHTNGHDDAGEFAGFELLDETEAIEPEDQQ